MRLKEGEGPFERGVSASGTGWVWPWPGPWFSADGGHRDDLEATAHLQRHLPLYDDQDKGSTGGVGGQSGEVNFGPL